MVPARNKTKRLSSVNHTTKTIYHYYHHHFYVKTNMLDFQIYISVSLIYHVTSRGH